MYRDLVKSNYLKRKVMYGEKNNENVVLSIENIKRTIILRKFSMSGSLLAVHW